MSNETPWFTPPAGPAPATPAPVAETPVTEPAATPDPAAARIAELERQLSALTAQVNSTRVTTDVTIPENAAGVGTDVSATWSQYDQELAKAGMHPHQLQQPAPWLG